MQFVKKSSIFHTFTLKVQKAQTLSKVPANSYSKERKQFYDHMVLLHYSWAYFQRHVSQHKIDIHIHMFITPLLKISKLSNSTTNDQIKNMW
jgi:hypothetical protein